MTAATRRGMLALACAALFRTRWAAAQAPREIELTAQRFRFTPGVITMKVGEPVLLLIRSLDFMHGFHVPELGLRADLVPGRVTRVSITPKTAGRLDFVCDNFCGDHHEEMNGHFTVVA
jgi:cytochrome c oxidase subunit 2